MSVTWGEGSDRAERLSALLDGELASGECAAACAAWKTDSDARQAWHAYHLIGDVLRSEDLCSPAGHDRRFLAALQVRLAAEPVVLAPTPLLSSAMSSAGSPAGSPRSAARSRWMLSGAMAAGFLLVAGTFVVLGPSGPLSPSASRPVALAAATTAPAADPALQRVSLGGAADLQPIVVNARMLRDARLDRYLAAHKQFAGTSALGVPSAFLSSATVDVEPR